MVRCNFLPRYPAPLIAIGASIASVHFLGLADRGVEAIGAIPIGLPHPTLPDAALAARLWPAAAGIALMSFTETIAAARAFSRSGEPLLQPNRELLATGVATAGGALLGAMPAGGGTSQTAVNRLAGAQSQMAGVITVARRVLTMLFLASLMGLMPHATLAAVVIVYSLELVRPIEFRVDPGDPPHGVRLGTRRPGRGDPARHAPGDPGRHRRVVDLPRPPGSRPAGLRARAQAQHERVSAALRTASRRRDASQAFCLRDWKGASSSSTLSASDTGSRR